VQRLALSRQTNKNRLLFGNFPFVFFQRVAFSTIEPWRTNRRQSIPVLE
jgi:hypothetical protein